MPLTRGAPTAAAPERPDLPGRSRRRWLTAAALVIAIALIGLAQLTGFVSKWANDELERAIERSVATALSADATAAERRRVFSVDPQGRPTAAELAEFAAAFGARYGPVASVSITGIAADEPGDDLARSASGAVRTPKGEILFAIRFRIVPGSTLEIALRGLEIFDRPRESLAVGEATTRVRSPSTAPDAPKESAASPAGTRPAPGPAADSAPPLHPGG